MGLIYEVSKVGESHQAQPPAAPQPIPIASAPAAPLSATAAWQPRTDWGGGDMFVMGCLGLVVGTVAFVILTSVLALISLLSAPEWYFTLSPAEAQVYQYDLLLNHIPSPYTYLFVQLNLGLVYIVAALYLFVRMRGNRATMGFARVNTTMLQYALLTGALSGLGIVGGTVLGYQVSEGLASLTTEVQRLLTIIPPPLTLVILLMGVVIFPLLEEIVFRGILYSWLRRRLGLFWSIGISALVFSLVPVIGLVGLWRTLLGVMLAIVYERSQSVWGSYAAHVTFNFVAVVIFLALTMVA
ncbi:MAG: CPBP family intramembrane glutamic endopeptidase [Phototrophicaceae bacterium]|jgi:membrane protease YdiL (CAAX protease family)